VSAPPIGTPMNAETKPCRHCGEAILAQARMCKHCHSAQGWLAGQKDPRLQKLVLIGLVPFFALVGFAIYETRSRMNRVSSTIAASGACRGLVLLKNSTHVVSKGEQGERILVRFQLENRATTAVSDPTIQIDVLDSAGLNVDAFHKTIYGLSIEPGKATWSRVEGDLVSPSPTIASVKADVVSADCKSAWR
jgi:hypothetical protein